MVMYFSNLSVARRPQSVSNCFALTFSLSGSLRCFVRFTGSARAKYSA